ncbi:MAG: recombinase family protein [Leptolyngbyaceae cyanobacterium bins.59]|nr:recombinase family protein [Leptolyngbyaceae cyanobacterium bins.59]
MRIVAYIYCDPSFDLSPPDLGNWEVERVYRDLGGRQQWQQLLVDCRLESPDYVLIQRLEALGRSLDEVHTAIAALEALGVPLIALEATAGTPGYLPTERAALLKLFQEIQTQQRSQRIREGHARNRVKALPPPGRAPYGYRRGKDRYALDRAAANVVKDFFEYFLLYGSLRGAVRHLEKKHGKKISASTGQRWLTNPVYRGDLAYQNGQVIPNTHVAIISREEAAQVDRLLRRNRRLPPRTASAPRSLAGLVVCDACQSSMTISRVTTPRERREYLYLRPTACPRRPRCSAIAYEQVLDQTIAAICDNLPKAVAGRNSPDLSAIKQSFEETITAKQRILDQLPSLIDSNILDSETAELRAYKVRTEISGLQDRLAQLPPVNLLQIAQTVSIPQFWLDLSEAERRFYFREFLRQVRLVRLAETWTVQLVFIF